MSERALQHRSDTLIWAVVAIATLSVVALAIVQSRRRAPPPSGKPAAAAFTVSLPALDTGQPRALPQGKVTLVDFWATWCAPCRVSMPRVEKLYSEYTKKGMELYSVNTDDAGPNRTPNVQEFLLQQRLDFPVVLDDGRAMQAFSVAGLPTMVLLDKQGQVAWTDVGALSNEREAELRRAIDRALQ